MDPRWIIVILLWGILIGIITAIIIREARKSPEQKKKEQAQMRKILEEKRRNRKSWKELRCEIQEERRRYKEETSFLERVITKLRQGLLLILALIAFIILMIVVDG